MLCGDNLDTRKCLFYACFLINQISRLNHRFCHSITGSAKTLISIETLFKRLLIRDKACKTTVTVFTCLNIPLLVLNREMLPPSFGITGNHRLFIRY